MAAEEKNQPNWRDNKLEDLRDIDRDYFLAAPNLLEAGKDRCEALAIAAKAFQVLNGERIIKIPQIDFWVTVTPKLLEHIVEKRNDARERYSNFALETLTSPYEIWKVLYTDGGYRLAFIGLFVGRKSMLVVINILPDGHVLWNFMHCEVKKLNKHRIGTLIYSNSKPK